MTRVGIRCDSGPMIGVGHLVRCLALAEELLSRGIEVVLLGELGGVAWAERQVSARGLALLPGPRSPAGLVSAARLHDLHAVVLDSYTLDPACAAALRAAGVAVLAIVDGDARGQDADLYLDQNLGATPVDDRWLTGPRYVLLRDSVRTLRRDARRAPPPQRDGGGESPRVLCFFGGTDAGGAAPVVARSLAATGAAFAATVVTTHAHQVDPPLAAGQSCATRPPTDDLPRLAVASDLVVTACGSGVWEMLHLGVPMALVWAAENQRDSYRRLVAAGLAAGLGHIDEVRAAPAEAVARLGVLLADQGRRAALAVQGKGLIDGRGRERVADAVLSVRSRPR